MDTDLRLRVQVAKLHTALDGDGRHHGTLRITGRGEGVVPGDLLACVRPEQQRAGRRAAPVPVVACCLDDQAEVVVPGELDRGSKVLLCLRPHRVRRELAGDVPHPEDTRVLEAVGFGRQPELVVAALQRVRACLRYTYEA